MFPLLLSLEIFTGRSSELCLSKTVGLSFGSGQEPVDRDRSRQRVVELLSRTVFSGKLVELESLLVLKKKTLVQYGMFFRQIDAKAVILDR